MRKLFSIIICVGLVIYVTLMIFPKTFKDLNLKMFSSPHQPDFMDLVQRMNCDQKTNISHPIRDFFSENSILERTKDCENYFKVMYVFAERMNLTEDDEFPIAYSHLIHRDVGVFETFLAIHYRPKDVHCVYVDLKAPSIVQEAVDSLIKCYNQKFYGSNEHMNLFAYKFPMPVWWGHISILEADLACLRQLMAPKYRWKYFMNLAGSELPMKTVSEMQQILKRLKSKSISMSVVLPSIFKYRATNRFKMSRFGLDPFDIRPIEQGKVEPPPFNLTIFKGARNVILSRKEAKFVTTHPIG